jgi:hypothetical protein
MGQKLSTEQDHTLLQEMEDEFFGNVSLLYSDENPYTLKCAKKYSNSFEAGFSSPEENMNNISFNPSQNTLKFLEKRIKSLPLAIH